MDAFAPTPPEPVLLTSICRCASPHEHASRAVDNATSSHASEIAHQRREADVVLATANKRIAELRATPAARFPGNDTGWADAIEYAERKRAGTIR
jgi:hypothetical protein